MNDAYHKYKVGDVVYLYEDGIKACKILKVKEVFHPDSIFEYDIEDFPPYTEYFYYTDYFSWVGEAQLFRSIDELKKAWGI